jgi:hypothetical protein
VSVKQPKTERVFVIVIVENQADKRLLAVLRDLYGREGIWMVNKRRVFAGPFLPAPQEIFWTFTPNQDELHAASNAFPGIHSTFLVGS